MLWVTKTLKSVFISIWGSGKATLLTVMMALTLATVTPAFGANGQAFILGSLSNAATAPTRLQGNVAAGPALQVINPNTAASARGLDVLVASGKPPIYVSPSAGKATNLNADKVDGKDSNGLVRAALGTNKNLGSGLTFTAQTSVAVNAPASGFVIVNGTVTAATASTECNPCAVHTHLRNATTNQLSVDNLATVGNATPNTNDNTVPLTWVFPVSAGDNTIELQTAVLAPAGAINFTNPTLTALYVPYGATGTSTLGPNSN